MSPHLPDLLLSVSIGNLTVIVLAGLIVRYIKRCYFTALFDIPGPFAASVTRGWRVKEVYYGRVEKTELELHELPDPLVRTGPNEVVTNDPEAIDLLYGTGSKFEKTDFYTLFGFPDVHGIHQFSALSHALHKKLIRFTAAAFSMTTITELKPHVDSPVDVFVSRIKDLGANGKPMNMAEWFQWYAFDVMGEVTFSKRDGFMDRAKDIGDSTKMLDKFHAYISFVGQAFTYHWILLGNPLLSLFLKPPSGIIGEMAVREVQARQGRCTNRRDMLSRFLKEHEKNPEGFTIEDIYRNEAMTIGASSDTTGIALTATLYHPTAYAQLRAEIDQATSENKLSRPSKLHETTLLPYLQAVVKEGMRVHPSVAFILPRHVPEGGCTISGKFLPAGTRVGMNPYVVYRNKNIFGEDAHLFRPERWIERNEKTMDRDMLQFCSGSRICSGRHISIMEMNKILVELIRHFDIQLADENFKLTTTTRWFMKPHALPCTFTPRASS